MFTDLTPLPPAPTRESGDPDDFAAEADAFVSAIVVFGDQLNVFQTELEAAAALIAAAPAYADAGLVSIADLTIGADEFIYGSATDTFSKGTITSFARSILDDADSDAVMTTLGFTANGRSLVAADNAGMRTQLSLYSQAQVDSAISTAVAAALPSGAVSAFAMTTVPAGWLKCDGAAVSRTTYAALFTAIGTTHGTGDGSTTFNVPDLRGEFVRGWDDGRGIDSGRSLGSSQDHELESHSHDIRYHVRNIDGSDNEGDGVLLSSASYASGYIQSTGGSETRPRNIALQYCIKA